MYCRRKRRRLRRAVEYEQGDENVASSRKGKKSRKEKHYAPIDEENTGNDIETRGEGNGDTIGDNSNATTAGAVTGGDAVLAMSAGDTGTENKIKSGLRGAALSAARKDKKKKAQQEQQLLR